MSPSGLTQSELELVTNYPGSSEEEIRKWSWGVEVLARELYYTGRHQAALLVWNQLHFFSDQPDFHYCTPKDLNDLHDWLKE